MNFLYNYYITICFINYFKQFVIISKENYNLIIFINFLSKCLAILGTKLRNRLVSADNYRAGMNGGANPILELNFGQQTFGDILDH